MERRTFLGMIAGGVLAAPLAGEAQRVGKVYRIGYLATTPPTPLAPGASRVAVIWDPSNPPHVRHAVTPSAQEVGQADTARHGRDPRAGAKYFKAE